MNAFLRVDKAFDVNPSAGKISYLPFSAEAKSTLLITGLDISVFEGINLMPNLEAVFYDEENGSTVNNELLPRITFKYKF